MGESRLAQCHGSLGLLVNRKKSLQILIVACLGSIVSLGEAAAQTSTSHIMALALATMHRRLCAACVLVLSLVCLGVQCNADHVRDTTIHKVKHAMFRAKTFEVSLWVALLLLAAIIIRQHHHHHHTVTWTRLCRTLLHRPMAN